MGWFRGLLVGVIIGLLVAPQRGDAMREELRQRGEELLRKADGVVARARPVVQEARERGREVVTEVRRQVRDASVRDDANGGQS